MLSLAAGGGCCKMRLQVQLWSEPESAMRVQASEHERALRDFTCKLCKCVLTEPLSTPCGHHFCKPCLTKKFEARAPPHCCYVTL